jgi:hypothetical protein
VSGVHQCSASESAADCRWHGSQESREQVAAADQWDQYTLIKKPMEHLGKHLNVPGSFWQGHMSEDERDKI